MISSPRILIGVVLLTTVLGGISHYAYVLQDRKNISEELDRVNYALEVTEENYSRVIKEMAELEAIKRQREIDNRELREELRRIPDDEDTELSPSVLDFIDRLRERRTNNSSE